MAREISDNVEELGLRDKAYVNLCNFALDKGSWIVSGLGGLTTGDSNSSELSNKAMAYCVVPTVATNGSDEALEIADISKRAGREDVFESYVLGRAFRDLSAFGAGACLARGGVVNLVYSVFFGLLSLGVEYFGVRSEKKNAEKLKALLDYSGDDGKEVLER